MSALVRCFAFLVLASSSVYAADVSVAVSENPVKANSFAVVTVAVEKGDQVSFQVFPTPTKRETFGNKLVLSGPPGTKYTVLVTVVNFGEDKDDSATKGYKKRFDSGQQDVTMEGPKPAPDDEEPNPPPAPDTEAATLTSKLKATFKTESAEEKILAPKLRDLYAKYASESELMRHGTYGELDAAMRKDAAEYGVAGKLTATQTAIAEYLVTKIPGRNEGWDNVVLAQKERTSARKAFTSVSTALEKLK